MSTAARWSLRLPRASARLMEHRGARHGVRKLDQRRWNQGGLPKRRAWASAPQKADEKGRSLHQSRQNNSAQEQQQQPQDQQVGRNTQLAATLAQSDTSDLVTEVRLPDDPNGVIPPDHPALSILNNSSLVIQRQLEMMNVMLGFEQANRYIIMDGQGQTLGYAAEKDNGIGSTMARQAFRTHRSFTTHIFDAQEREVLRIHRPFTYINSRIRVYDPLPEGGYSDTETSTALHGTSASSAVNQGSVAQISPLKLDEMRIIGEAQQQWAPLRRKYNLFIYRAIEPSPKSSEAPRIESGDQPTSDTKALTESEAPDQAIEAGMAQFAHVNEPFLAMNFTLRDESQNTIGNVNRNFVGFARELFTDTGVYVLRMDSAAQTTAPETADGTELSRYERDATAMTLDQRAVMLATAVSIDFDYFSRHSHGGGMGFMPIFWPGAGGTAEGGAAGAGAGAAGGTAVGEAGVLETAGAASGAEAATTAVGNTAARGVSGAGAATESGIAGAGTMAGYEAMQRGVYGSRGQDDAIPQTPESTSPAGYPGDATSGQGPEQAENRPGNDDVWGEGQDPWSGGQSSGGGDSSGGSGGGWIDSISDFFDS